MDDDKDLIREVLDGRRESFAPLVRRHQARVLSLCLSLLRDRAAAEDAAQDVFLKAYRGLSGFRSDAAFSTWLYRIATRRCLDLLRSAGRRRTEPLESLLHEPAAPPEPEPGAADAILSALPGDYRAVLVLREVQGLSYDEIARATSSSLDSVKARLRRARAALQESARHFLTGTDVQQGGGAR